MSWVYLVLAGLFEIGWPVGLKMAQNAETRWTGISVAVGFMAVSGFLLWLAQRQIPIGTAYGPASGRRVRSWWACFITETPRRLHAISASR